ncbi:CTP synthase [Apiospora arundinis]
MDSILELPVELVIKIIGNLDNPKDWKPLARVNSTFYILVIQHVWRGLSHMQKCQILMWACVEGNKRTLCRVFESADITANLQFQANYSPTSFSTESFMQPVFQEAFNPSFTTCVAPHGNVIMDTTADGIWTPLHLAVRSGHIEIIENILQRGASVDALALRFCGCRPIAAMGRRLTRYTALHVAICTGQEEIAKLLLSNGASIYTDHFIDLLYGAQFPGRSRYTAFHDCATHNLLGTARFLIEQGHKAEIDELDEYGHSPLMYAYQYEHDDLLDILLAHGASTRTTTSDNGAVPSSRMAVKAQFPSLLHQACHDCRWEVVAKLVNHGSNVLEPDRLGKQPLLLCIQGFAFRAHYPDEENLNLGTMVNTIKSCQMHIHADQDTLKKSMKLALQRAMLPVVSLLLDAGLDSSTMLKIREPPPVCETSHRPQESVDVDTEVAKPQAFDRASYYSDTGHRATEQTILEYACYHYEWRRGQPNQAELIELLLSRACAKPGDIDCHVRALKNLCCCDWEDFPVDYREEDDGDDESDSGISVELYGAADDAKEQLICCAQMICGSLSSTLEGERKPRLPIDLFFVCAEQRQCLILEETLEVFDLTSTEYTEQELWQVFDHLTKDTQPFDSWRQVNVLEYLFRVDRNNYLLQHPQVFERLCKCLITSENGELAILDYLDRGGRYCLEYQDGTMVLYHAIEEGCIRLTERLLDMGADPNRLCAYPKDKIYYYRKRPRAWWLNRNHVPILRLLLERGANPFQMEGENLGLGFPFGMCIEYADTKKSFAFFSELCQLALNDGTDDGDLFDILYLACSAGRSKYIEVVRSRVGSRVDAIICEKADLFLQKLLINLFPISRMKWDHIDQMDEAIDTMRQILHLGGHRILTSSWRLNEGKEDFTAVLFHAMGGCRAGGTTPSLPWGIWTCLHCSDIAEEASHETRPAKPWAQLILRVEPIKPM